MAFAAFADAPVDVAVLEVGLGGLWDATNVVDAGTAVVLPVGLDHVPLLGTTLAEIAAEKAGIIAPGRHRRARPAGARGRARCCCGGASRSAPPSPARAWSSASSTRVTAVGGQLLSLQGLGGRYDDVYLPLHGAHQAANAAAALAAVEAFLGGGDKGMLDPELVREGFARVAEPRPARGRPHQPDRAARRRPQRPRHDRHGDGARRRLRVHPPRRGRRGARRQGRPGDARGARAGGRVGRRHAERLAARDARRRPRRRWPATSSARSG